jgi:hypothetical protein
MPQIDFRYYNDTYFDSFNGDRDYAQHYKPRFIRAMKRLGKIKKELSRPSKSVTVANIIYDFMEGTDEKERAWQ